ncbi:MAG: GAF domain-containing protein [Tissierellia bacterium]|nr:GAF domain-containing protein [Tissierellia bacterium]
MYRIKSTIGLEKIEKYDYIRSLISTQLRDEVDIVSNLSNISAMIMACLEDLNWAGFYLFKGGELVLGPFQGLPACNRIKIGEGVCGRAAEKRESILVKDVEKFPGHIACDENSKSELVIPIISEDQLIAVLDLDSPTQGRFDEVDKEQLEEIMNGIAEFLI